MSGRSKGEQKRKLSTLRSNATKDGKLAATAAPERGFAWLWGLLLAAATVIAYWPALHGNFVWDDDSWTTRIAPLLRDVAGLRSLWFDPATLQQYYPLTGTTFWLDYHLWGFSPLPYHVENVLLHACAALLFWKLLARLEVPGAWLAAAIFALHPIMVESAGWITERKNVLSLVLYLGALLAYGRFTGFWREDELTTGQNSPRRWGAWALAFFLLLGALLAKTTAFSLPAVILLLCWWQRGRIRWRDDVLPALPLFTLAIGMSLVTASLEKNHVGAQGPDWSLSFPQRCLIAGRVFWFYLGKLIWPANLCFVYPRWNPDPNSLAQWLYPFAATGLLLGFWLARKRIGRGPATVAFFFVGTLFPVLGFMNAYFMRYSFVCDHWVYLSSLAPIALAAALIVRVAARLRAPAIPYIFAGLVLPAFAVLTWRQGGMYADMETLWRTTLARNPDCAMAHNNLGVALTDQGKLSEAIQHCERAIDLKPDDADAHYNLGRALAAQDNPTGARQQYERALQLKPDDAEAHNNLGSALAAAGNLEAAAEHYQQALKLEPNNAEAHNNLGIALEKQGKLDEAASHFEQALRLNPGLAEACYNLGNALAKSGKPDQAIQQYERALQLNPDLVAAHVNLGVLLAKVGKLDEAIQHYELALQFNPDIAEAQCNLGDALAAQRKPEAAAHHYQEALDLATAQNKSALADTIRARLKSVQQAVLTPN